MSRASYVKWLVALGLIGLAFGCRRQNSPPAEKVPDSAGQEAASAADTPKPEGASPTMAELLASAGADGAAALPPGHPPLASTMPDDVDVMMGTTLPAGHPPLTTMPAGPMTSGTSLPAGHPPISGQNRMVFTGDLEKPEQMLELNPPESWVQKQSRPMTVAVYELPKAGAAPAGAELTVSHYPGMRNIPLDMQVKRWAGQFEQAQTRPAGEAVKQTKLKGTAHPTTLVDLAGRYRSGSMMMMGHGAAPKENYRMMVAIVETDQGPWFFKLIGPQATVAAHETEFVEFVRAAK